MSNQLKSYWIRQHKMNPKTYSVFNSKPVEWMSYRVIEIKAKDFKEAKEIARKHITIAGE